MKVNISYHFHPSSKKNTILKVNLSEIFTFTDDNIRNLSLLFT